MEFMMKTETDSFGHKRPPEGTFHLFFTDILIIISFWQQLEI
uniref:Uncharacterized protein n=1 Tax=Anguilla anguilla TaxID=7936 RepID=A0A0E9REH0_ANGAN